MSATESVIVYADGGSRGNPGPAGYGSVVVAADGVTVLAERNGYLGRATNNVAEYSGLIAGLTAARDLGATEVAVRMDSKLVVEQLSGRWQVKHPDMKPLAATASALLAGFSSWSLTWIPRSQNSAADRLANEAMDSGLAGRDPIASGIDSGARAPAEITDPAAVLPGPLPTGATRVLIVRHGETTWGADGRFAGREDVPLTNRGRRQASSVADRIKGLRPSVVLTSPLQRCRLTAQAIGAAADAPVVVHDRLLDGLLGDWTGFRPAEIERRWPEQFAVWRSDTGAQPPGGESFDEIRDRVGPLIEEVGRLYRGHTVVLVTHAATTKMLLTSALGVASEAAYRLRVDTASLSGFTVDVDGGVVVWAVNETGHLTG
ncbi:probable phosphoglycerate mutase [Nakamurella panacisegetis]|uniref:Probable phosphoglycerate mutase n=1 Tax=Nakamurella panacisegetis TaxID=1090615 RepID=A0A1H0QYZ4_9ACTN|nr:probable phosphoglycerate mutase [Nakamurella panacisegetis]